jgi:hypothetical protein
VLDRESVAFAIHNAAVMGKVSVPGAFWGASTCHPKQRCSLKLRPLLAAHQVLVLVVQPSFKPSSVPSISYGIPSTAPSAGPGVSIVPSSLPTLKLRAYSLVPSAEPIVDCCWFEGQHCTITPSSLPSKVPSIGLAPMSAASAQEYRSECSHCL